MARTLKDLALALLNATLILLAICLFLGLKIMGGAERVSANVRDSVSVVTPLRNDLQSARDELAAIRSDLEGIRTAGGEAASVTMQALEARVAQVQTRMDGAAARVDALSDMPGMMIDRAIETAATQGTAAAKDLIGCRAPQAASDISS